MKDHYADWFWDGLELEAGEEIPYEKLQKASAWYHAAYSQPFFGEEPPFYSFAWIAYKPLCRIKALSQVPS